MRGKTSRVLAVVFALACSTGDDGSVGNSAQEINASPTLADFVLYADKSITVATHDSVSGGDTARV